MKKITVFLAFVLIFCAVFVPVPSYADEAPITGVDYDRFGQSVGLSRYEVELRLGDLNFPGTLENPEAMSLAEMNRIIREEMKEHNMTERKLLVLSKIISDLDREARNASFENFLRSTMELLPSLPGLGVGDYYDWFMYGEVKDREKFGLEIFESFLIKGSEVFLAGIMGTNYWESCIANNGKLPGIKGFGAVAGGIKTIISNYHSENKRFNRFLEQLADSIGEVAAFYADCTRRMNEYSQSKKGEGTRIVFKEVMDVGGGTFWGIEGVSAKWVLDGTLRRKDAWERAEGASGMYEGELTLTGEGLDMSSSFDYEWVYRTTVLPATVGYYGAGTMYDLQAKVTGQKFGGLFSSYQDHANKRTQLKVSATGRFTVSVGSLEIGTNEVVPRGYFGNSKYTPEFVFDHTVRRRLVKRSGGAAGEWPDEYEEIYLKSEDINTLIFSAKGVYYSLKWNGGASYTFVPTDGSCSYMEDLRRLALTAEEVGTLLNPIKSKPFIDIEVPNTLRVNVTVDYKLD